MNAPNTGSSEDPLLSRMKAARKGPSVLKMDLVNLRAQLPNTLILVFEGTGDKGVYFNWLKRASPEIDYEPFPCDGKTFVLELKKVVDRDLNHLASGVYFFVDRDFDDLRGVTPDASIFMTDQYSIENYMVTERVLEELLKNELHCHAQPQLRTSVMADFTRIYDDFLEKTRDINFRLYCARRLGIPTRLPSKIGHLARLDLTTVTILRSTTEIVSLEREPSEEEVTPLTEEFESLRKRERYRGKFACLFLLEWLKHLAMDRVSETSTKFAALPKNVKVKLQTITTENLASKSDLPSGLNEFVRSMTFATEQ